MSNINIKIIEVDPSTLTILVKYASDTSAKSVDEYDPIAFRLTDPTITTPEAFIESIRADLTYLVAARDIAESTLSTVDITSWYGYSATVNAVAIVDPAAVNQQVAGLANPEVEL